MACTTVQTFCASCQIVKEHPIFNSSKGFKFSKTATAKTKASPLFINEAVDALKKISEYGAEGTKNPSESELNTLKKVQSKEKITTNSYNLLLSVLKIKNKNVASKDKLLGSYFSNLENYINNYKLNDDRCSTCNATCQSGQSCHQGCGDTCENSCQTNCEGGICGCLVGCQGTCEYLNQSGCGSCQGGSSNCNSGCQGSESCAGCQLGTE